MWLNIYGLIFIVIIMIPNIVFAIKCKDGFVNTWKNPVVECLEQIGRFGCFGFMIITIPGTSFGFSSNEAFAIYLIVNSVLTFIYCMIWVVCFRKNNVFRAVALSVIPSIVFIFSGLMSHYVLLTIAAVIFAPSHILISYKNSKKD